MKRLCCLLAGLLAWTAAVPAQAAPAGGPRPESARRERPSLDEAVAELRRATSGRILSAQPRAGGRDDGYRVKMLMPDASVRSFDVPARGREPR